MDHHRRVGEFRLINHQLKVAISLKANITDKLSVKTLPKSKYGLT